ncbi:MAG: YbjN domain-containing protein [Allosphingosinicella sp.]
MRTVFAAFSLLAFPGVAFGQTAAAPVRWNPAAPENRQVLPTFNYATVEPVLAAIGARGERRGTPDRPAIAVTFANNRRAAILFGSCERQGAACKAISIQAVWTRPANVPPERLANNIQEFNRRYAFSRAFLTADGRPALQRYLTADFGFIRGNLAVNLLVFASQSERFAAEVLR